MAIRLVACAIALITVAQASPSLEKRDALTDCLTKASVPYAVSGSSNYTLESKAFNDRLKFTPKAIVLPTAVTHVQSAVKCAASAGVPVTAKSGGHSYAAHGLGGENGHLVIALKYMNAVTLDSATNIASVGAGARLGNVATALFDQGKRAISHGTCPGVGVGGLTLHGGYGYASRTHGLTLDMLTEAEVVLADGSVVTASTSQNSDLFWALRGAGSAFGIVTKFKFNTFAAPANQTIFTYRYNFANSSAAANALMAIQTYANTTQPAELNMRLIINGYNTEMSGVYYGSQAAFTDVINPLLKQLGNTVSAADVKTTDWIGMLTTYGYTQLKQPVEYDQHETFFSKSLMTTFTAAGAAAFSDYWYTTAKSNTRAWFVIIDLHGGLSSAISKVAPDATSYAHRNALLKFEFYDRSFFGGYPSDGFSFLNGWVNGVIKAQPSTKIGMYINYADTSLTATQAHQYYWLDNYDRLAKIKATYDPKKLFTNPQAVGSA